MPTVKVRVNQVKMFLLKRFKNSTVIQCVDNFSSLEQYVNCSEEKKNAQIFWQEQASFEILVWRFIWKTIK